MKNCFLVLVIFFTSLMYAQEMDSPSEIRREQFIQDFGDYAQHVPALASLVTIIIKKDKKGFWQFSKSYGTTLALTYVLKVTINKPRPDGRTDGYAFPSGHTSVAFSGASFLHRRYGWKFGVPAYLLATYVAYTRVEGIHDRHDGWDILGGALVGIGSTYLFTTPYEKEHFELTFNSGKGDYLVGFKYKF